MRAAIRLAGGREVCFVATVDDEGTVQTARVVARGDVRSVLALPGVANRGEMLVHNHPSGELEPSDADLEVALRMHDGGVGFGIIDNEARELYVVVEIPRERAASTLDDAAVGDALGPDGPVAAQLERYEDRPSQRAMARAIARLYNGGGIGLFEAGTGVGKSLGYLVPALRWAAANGERTIVSTNTINLQEQLVGKDLPFLQGALDDQPVRYALLKGWHNYLCLHRLEQASVGAPGLFEDDVASELDRLRAWATRTRDGSLSDLPTPPRPEVWDEVAAEPDLCGRLKCAHFDTCFLFAARRRAAQADVVVVNHHLLLSDLAVRRAQQNWGDAAVLPAYQRLIVDEGHHLEDAAAAHLGTTVTRRGLQRLLGRLDRRGKGLLNALVQRLSAQDDLMSVASLDLVHARLAPSVQAARDHGATVFDLLDTMLQECGETVMRLTPRFDRHPIWNAGLDASLTDLLREIALLHDGLRLVRERLELDATRRDAVAPLLVEMQGVARRLEGVGDGLARALRPPVDAEPMVRWIEVRGRERNIAASAVPLDIAPILREDLFKRVDTAVVTSATLASNERFTFLAGRLGLDEPEVEPETAVFPSPFAYEEQAILAVPVDVPAPNVDGAGHFRAVMRIVRDLAEASDGGLFVLFTSHRDVRAAAAELRTGRVDGRWPLLVHGEDGRDALLRRFRESGRAILLGTASFWEGVDVAGRALRGLVLAKLPFRVPTEPLTAAHCEAIEARGGDPFGEFMLPHAALRLKQGFGRLIRSGTDRGVVVLCDPRVVTKQYGRELLATLPPARRVIERWERIREQLQTFYREDMTE
ncbi:MAG TPA: helicase C-terminal domain-containing protein [Gemmatimonadaceae bacterium]|nr:helicase C-terminal domain-containing protein [Gemmatimonadaceae bacterium]